MLGGSLLFLAVALLLMALGVIRRRATPKPRVSRLFRTILALGLMSAVEELVFRAGILGVGSHYIGWPTALAVSTVAFALSHAFPHRLRFMTWVNLLLVGVLLGLTYRQMGIWAVIGLHWGWNAWEWGLGFTVSGEASAHLPTPPTIREVVDVPYGPEAHWATAMVMALAVAVTVMAPWGGVRP